MTDTTALTPQPPAPHAVLDTALDAVATAMSAKGTRRLEVRQLWEGNLLDVRAFTPDEAVTVGTESGVQWSILGRPMGWVDGKWSRVLRASPPGASAVGAAWRSDFVADDPAIEAGTSFTCVAVEHGRQVVRLHPSWAARVVWAGHRTDVATLLACGRAQREDGLIRIPLDDELAVAFQVGPIVLVAVRAAVSARVRAGSPADPTTLVMGAAVTAASAMIAFGLTHAPPSSRAAIAADADIGTVMKLNPAVPPPPVAHVPERRASSGAPARGAQGRAGAPRSRDPRDGSVDIRHAGVLDAWAGVESVMGPGLSTRLTASAGGLTRGTGGTFGQGGLADRGDGLGGGGTIDGMGGIETRGPGGPGHDPLGGPKARGTVASSPEELVQYGSPIDASLIDKEIKRKLSQIRYCYQRELQLKPGLGGTLSIAFTIAADGSVSRAGVKRDGLGSSAVADCVVARFHQMQFPRPAGGGLVMVTYPFSFAAD